MAWACKASLDVPRHEVRGTRVPVRSWSRSALCWSMAPALRQRPYLDEAVLLKTRSRKLCMTCHWVRHHAGVNCIPANCTRG